MSVYLITGVNRGIGLSLLNQLAQNDSNTVIGTVRSLDKGKNILELHRQNVHLLEMDMSSSQENIDLAVKKLENFAPNGIDVVIHNAGVLGAPNVVPFDDYKADDYLYPFQINVIGSVKLYKSLAPYLYKGHGKKKFVFVSSLAAKMSNSFIMFHGYGASKAALNYFMRQVHIDNQNSENPLKKEAVVYSIHPGLVDTDMAAESTGGNREILQEMGAITPDKSAADIIKTLDIATSGSFMTHDGRFVDF